MRAVQIRIFVEKRDYPPLIPIIEIYDFSSERLLLEDFVKESPDGIRGRIVLPKKRGKTQVVLVSPSLDYDLHA